MTFQEIRIIATGPCIANQLWDVDLYLEFDDSGQLSTKIYDKRDDINFKIINFPNMCSNIPASPAYGVYIAMQGPVAIILISWNTRLSYILVLSWPLSSNSSYKSKNDADEAVSVVSLTSSWVRIVPLF
jgi:hypothetical protein